MSADETLRGASIDVLLRSAYSLTHRIHELEDRYSDPAVEERAQREQIDAEIKRRVGEEYRCVCGRLFQSQGARSNHARKCLKEQVRSQAYFERIEASL